MTHYATKIVLPYSPSAVVVYAGENDLSWPWSKKPETILRDFQAFVNVVHGQLPNTWIYFLTVLFQAPRFGLKNADTLRANCTMRLDSS